MCIRDSYTLGDATHRWSGAYSEELRLSTGAGSEIPIYPAVDGSFEIDLPGGAYLYADNTDKIWSFGDGILVDGQNTTQNIIQGKTRFSDRGYHPNPFAGSRFLGEY